MFVRAAVAGVIHDVRLGVGAGVEQTAKAQAGKSKQIARFSIEDMSLKGMGEAWYLVECGVKGLEVKRTN